ncbi:MULTISPECIES: GatB family leaderless bacteriocin [Lactococcus]|uniref:Garvicin KS peptide B n=1 Tax=Lactococcus garvieae TaxID=1363 RepID=A0A1B0Z2M7_9LACT|nr:GatB family leaderless bacteriocin [Lactococcus lactis]ANO58543.1 garvicin KS peptide B [Lactococcus garvieae]
MGAIIKAGAKIIGKGLLGGAAGGATYGGLKKIFG